MATGMRNDRTNKSKHFHALRAHRDTTRRNNKGKGNRGTKTNENQAKREPDPGKEDRGLTPKQTNDAHGYEPEMGWYKGEVNELRREEYTPI